MKRDINDLINDTYDLIIIGGGIAGAFAAWDAALRGLSVALIEKNDFGAATSAASGKLIHGGIRFMQYGALNRVIESLHERMILRRIAPHMIQKVPFIIPTFGHLMKGREVLKIGMTVYEFLSRNKRNSGDPRDVLPVHRMLNRRQVIELEEGLASSDLNGGILFYECQMHNPERLTLSVAFAALEAGAQIANYVEVTDFKVMKNRVCGVRALDRITGEQFEINAKVVLNATGPWLRILLDKLGEHRPTLALRYSKGIHIVTRPITRKHALALTTRHRSAETLLQRGGRHYFIIPWRGRSLIGTTNEPFDGDPGKKMVTETDIAGLIQDVNAAYPAGKLAREDVLAQYGGLYIDEEIHALKGYQGGRKDWIIDHARQDKIEGLISCVCVKYTTARKLAQRTINVIFEKLGYAPSDCRTEQNSVYGGCIEQLDGLLDEAAHHNDVLDEDISRQLVLNYGDRHREICTYSRDYPDWCDRVHQGLPVIRAQIVHAVKEEMAQNLSDVIFRRTGIGTVGYPGESCLRLCAEIIAKELNWTENRMQEELAEVKDVFKTAL